MALHRFSQKLKKPICFAFLLYSPNILETWNQKSKSFKYFWTVMAKKKKMFVCFSGESMACQSAFSFIWPLVLTKKSENGYPKISTLHTVMVRARNKKKESIFCLLLCAVNCVFLTMFWVCNLSLFLCIISLTPTILQSL